MEKGRGFQQLEKHQDLVMHCKLDGADRSVGFSFEACQTYMAMGQNQ